MEENEEKLTLGQKKVKGILQRLKEFFVKEKEISHIKVNNSRQTFWVKDKKKIKFWMILAQKSASASFNAGTTPSIQILKVVYK